MMGFPKYNVEIAIDGLGDGAGKNYLMGNKRIQDAKEKVMSKTNGETMSDKSNFEYQKTYAQKRIDKGLCTKCNEKAVTKWYCGKHRKDLNRRRSIAYLEEKFKKKYNI